MGTVPFGALRQKRQSPLAHSRPPGDGSRPPGTVPGHPGTVPEFGRTPVGACLGGTHPILRGWATAFACGTECGAHPPPMGYPPAGRGPGHQGSQHNQCLANPVPNPLAFQGHRSRTGIWPRCAAMWAGGSTQHGTNRPVTGGAHRFVPCCVAQTAGNSDTTWYEPAQALSEMPVMVMLCRTGPTTTPGRSPRGRETGPIPTTDAITTQDES